MITALEGCGGQRHAPAAFYPGKDPVPIVPEAVWAPGPVWTSEENLVPTGIRSPDRPAHSQSLYRLSYRAHNNNYNNNNYFKCVNNYVYDYFNYRLPKLPWLLLLPLYQCLSGRCDIFCTVVAMVTTIAFVFRLTTAALVTEFTNLPAVSVATAVSKITKSRLYVV